jgi:hypothetical protein
MSEFSEWLTAAKPGDKYTYCTGFLARSGDTKVLAAGNDAWRAYELGLVYLVQKKLAKNDYEYIAVRAGLVEKKPRFAKFKDLDRPSPKKQAHPTYFRPQATPHLKVVAT